MWTSTSRAFLALQLQQATDRARNRLRIEHFRVAGDARARFDLDLVDPLAGLADVMAERGADHHRVVVARRAALPNRPLEDVRTAALGDLAGLQLDQVVQRAADHVAVPSV